MIVLKRLDIWLNVQSGPPPLPFHIERLSLGIYLRKRAGAIDGTSQILATLFAKCLSLFHPFIPLDTSGDRVNDTFNHFHIGR